MTHKEVVTRENGDQYLVSVSMYNEGFTEAKPKYNVCVQFRARGKRKWLNGSIDALTPGEIFSAQINLWDKLKPEKPAY